MSSSSVISRPVGVDLVGTGGCIGFNFRRTARALTNVYDLALQTSGVRSTQFAILVAIAKSGPPTYMGDLAGILLLDSSTLSRSLRLMQKQRLIAISRRSTMRRRLVTLSPRGAKALADSLPRWREVQEHLLAVIGNEQWKKLQHQLELLARHAVKLQESSVR